MLFKRERDDDSPTYMTRIIDKIWPAKKNAPKLHIAYAISVCEFFLNPENGKIHVSESSIKSQISKYLQRILNKEKLSSEDENDENGDDGAGSLEIQECDEEVVQGEGDDCEIQRDDNENIENDDYCSSEGERDKLNSLRKKYKKNIH